jgi:hypothetical protein
VLVSDISLEERAGAAVLTASVYLERQESSRHVEYRFRDCRPDMISTRGDTFVAGLLLPAMLAGEDLRIESPVSPQLLNRASEITDLLAGWRWRLSRVEVTAPSATDVIGGSAVGLFFSGGIDSYYSLLKNMEQHPSGPDAITHLIFGFGIDTIYGYDESYRTRVSSHIREIAEETGKKVIIFETNVRSDFARPAWTFHQGSALISSALALSPLLKRCIVSSGLPREDLKPWGSHPHLDPLWSLESLEVVHDGIESYRTHKARTHIARSELALRTLRVCFEPAQQPKNCGRCNKCIQSMIALHAAGCLEDCSTFVEPLDLKRVRWMRAGGRRYAVDKLLDVLGDSKFDRQLRRAIRFALWRHDRKEAIKRLIPWGRKT